MPPLSPALTKQKLCIDFKILKHACPKGVYVAPVPENPLLWSGVVFVRKGQYAGAILRFQIEFPEDYPERAPVVSFLSDVFHPLITPLTTYTYNARDTDGETISAADREHLPPGGLNLRFGFPAWFETARAGTNNRGTTTAHAQQGPHDIRSNSRVSSASLTVEILQYLHVVFDTEAIQDAVPLEAAANAGAWHAWRSYRSKAIGGRASPTPHATSVVGGSASERSSSPRQQPGGARRPGEWNWQGVWEDRVKKSIQASISEHVLYSGDQGEVICFSKMEPDALSEMMSKREETGEVEIT